MAMAEIEIMSAQMIWTIEPGGRKTAKPTRKSLRAISMSSKYQYCGLYGW